MAISSTHLVADLRQVSGDDAVADIFFGDFVLLLNGNIEPSLCVS